MCFITHLIFNEFIFWLRCCNIYVWCVVTDRRLMPAFVRLSKDDVHRVRRACAESCCCKYNAAAVVTGVPPG